ncbi:DUF4260 domain-containing protein [Guptibacillus algicola]|uniref:DUF4260 domain-containing protein n=1 Tax=Guptibacillus algicola TaxID=225844 RepID=UPI001CD2968B|nr:DUF4260 domain-containing protein [Alkalihalobacillus algicola]MCA0987605.1 DUF4260 domain-containing protein [Alkalihalobacillus algicola]
MTKLFLHVEGFVVLILSIYFYSEMNVSWWLFLLLLFAPDVAMFGYMFGTKVGSYAYNVLHTYSLPLTILLFSLIGEQTLLVAIGLIWTAHIGMDRMIGYGLKSTEDFKVTHLQKV